MKFCISCGVSNVDDAKFCGSCGTKFVDNKSEIFDKKKTAAQEPSIRKHMSFFQFFFSSKGRISRKEFFIRGFLPLSSLLILTQMPTHYFNVTSLMVDMGLTDHFLLSSSIVLLYIIIMYSISAVSIKRLHDINKSGFFAILNFIPIINIILLSYLLFNKSVNTGNNYGSTASSYSINMFFFILKILIFLISWYIFALAINYEKYLTNNQNSDFSVQDTTLKQSVQDTTSKQKEINEKAEFYSLTINTNPKNTKIYITNIKPKYYDGIKLKAGKYTLKIKKEGYQSSLKTIDLTKDEVLNISLTKIHSNNDLEKLRPEEKVVAHSDTMSINNLMWQNEEYTTEESKGLSTNSFSGYNFNKVQNWVGAKRYCRKLRLDGYKDWRLPSKSELIVLLEYSKTLGIRKDVKHPSGRRQSYWTANTHDINSSLANFVDFHYGSYNYSYKKDEVIYVRCVRNILN